MVQSCTSRLSSCKAALHQEKLEPMLRCVCIISASCSSKCTNTNGRSGACSKPCSIYGSFCMDHSAWIIAAWIIVHGSFCMDHSAWIILHGSFCMDHSAWIIAAWIILHGSLQHGQFCMLSKETLVLMKGSEASQCRHLYLVQVLRL